MSKHDHDEKHRCECEHTRVKFCKNCQVAHCQDCQVEWVSRSNTSWPWTYYQTQPKTWPITYNWPTYTYSTGTTTLAGTSKLLSNTTTATSAPTVSKLCDHGEQ